MYFLPLGQIESVDVVIHVLTTGADCSTCPSKKFCTPDNVPCALIGKKLQAMAAAGHLVDVELPTPTGRTVEAEEPQPQNIQRKLKSRLQLLKGGYNE